MRAHQNRVFRIALRWLRSVEEAQDVTQDVFLTLSRKLSQFEGDARLSSWVYRVAVNHAKNRLRYLSRRCARAHEAWDDRHKEPELTRGQRTLPGPHDVLVGRELASQLEVALATLSPMHRQMVLWRDLDGWTYEAIAVQLGLPQGTVKSRLHRARVQLHALLAEQDITPVSGARASRRRVGSPGPPGEPR
jgi:RNA polymerase sigma-70 factor (ECF subfamily)